MLQPPLLKTMNGYIDGKWCVADSDRTMPVINPAIGETIAIVPVMGHDESTRAADTAARTLTKPASIEQRCEWLGRLADLITQHRDELGRIITHEHGKPLAEAEGETDYVAN